MNRYIYAYSTESNCRIHIVDVLLVEAFSFLQAYSYLNPVSVFFFEPMFLLAEMLKGGGNTVLDGFFMILWMSYLNSANSFLPVSFFIFEP